MEKFWFRSRKKKCCEVCHSRKYDRTILGGSALTSVLYNPLLKVFLTPFLLYVACCFGSFYLSGLDGQNNWFWLV